jgi:drug/metabolite transporter (DMT)-like permease
LLPFAIVKITSIEKNKFLPLLAVGIFGNVLPAFLFAIAQTKMSSSFVGLLNSSVPLFTLILGVLFFSVPFKKKASWGVVVGLVGTLVLIFSGGIPKAEGDFVYAFLPIVASISYALSANTIKRFLQEISPMTITSVAFLLSAVPVLIYAIYSGTLLKPFEGEAEMIGFVYVFVLAFFGTVIALLVFNLLIKQTSAVFASMVTYLIPIVALSWGLFDGEDFHILYVVGMGVTFSGIYLVNKS